MFHHSFEHVNDPLRTLLSARRLLCSGGTCLIRMPTTSSWAWRQYRESWCQIDAPRHTYLHSVESVRILASRAGFKLDRVIYDSTALQFWGSERYAKRRSLLESLDPTGRPLEYSPGRLAHFRRQARKLNDRQNGDQVAFYLSTIA
jgi:hypothetical protein